MMRALLLVVAVCGCIDAQLVPCDDGRDCPAGTACDLAHHSCVAPDQLTACLGQPDLAACHTSAITDGRCFAGVCLAAGCGNGQLEPGELCDDGNTISGDGCSADCLSREICGDGYADRSRGEECDDGNLRGHDGCSSACTHEVLRWQLENAAPPTRSHAAMAYDTTRDRLVVVGGGTLDDTWEWNGANWIEITPDISPSHRDRSAMSYDPKRHRVVLFGGAGDFGILNDTWEWDGTTWIQHHPSIAPPARFDFGIAWDATTQRTIVFGGNIGAAVIDDTWAWDGQTWTQIATPTTPPARAQHAMASDPRRGTIVMFGGTDQVPQPLFTGVAPGNDTWEFDGKTWSQVAQGGSPPTVESLDWCAMAFDAGRGVMVLSVNAGSIPSTWELVGGVWQLRPSTHHPDAKGGSALAYDLVRDRIVQYGDMSGSKALWEWDGSDWTTRDPALVPAYLSGAVVDDRARGVLVMFGGDNGTSGPTNETWEWSSGAWQQRMPAMPPSARTRHAMVYDEASRRVVMFGGFIDVVTPPVNDTWLWDGNAWTHVATSTAPSPRYSATMVYDAARHVTVLFGGTDGTIMLGDTWEWDGATWTQRAPPTSPPARGFAQMSYDRARHRTVLYGGVPAFGSIYLADTWEWDGTTWTQIATVTTPGPRTDQPMVYDDARERVILLGGTFDISIWEWDGAQWTQPTVVPAPFPRQAAATTYDSRRSCLVMLGGEASLGVLRPLGELWTIGYSGSFEEVCGSGADVDGDHLLGCDDPDCAAECGMCGDGACAVYENDRSCPADCAASTPICGDGFCAAGETIATCPGDCP